jgi:uncharacterized membrane protein YbhN (UPF0104 family)
LNLSQKRIRTLLIPVQVAVSLLILYLLFQNVNLSETYQALSHINIPVLGLSIAFFILSSLSIGFALHGALKATNAAPPLRITQLANFGGQLLSDVTPAKSGYFATPVLLNQLRAVPLEKGMISVMSVGAFNFFIKAAFSTIALIYFLTRINIDPTMVQAMLLGITLLLVGGIGLTVLVWTNCFSGLLQRLSKLPIIGILIRKLESLRATFSKDKVAIRKSAKTIIISILASVLFSGISLYVLAQALSLAQPTFLDMLFMGPLTAVFMYVPITFAGLGLQEAAYVFLLTNIGAPLEIALPFALLVRLLAVSTDLIGLPSLTKTSTGLLSKLNRKPVVAENSSL